MYRSLISFLVLALSFAAPASAQSSDATEASVAAMIDQVRSDCASFESGKLTVTANAVTRTDLTGDGIDDAVVDTAGLECSSAASLYCGTGGCTLFLVTGAETMDVLAKGWKVVDWGGDRVLLLQIHGANCGGTNLRRCYRAMVWSEEGWRFTGN